MEKKLAGIDIGTTNTKMTVYNEIGAELAHASYSYPNRSVHSIPADSIWDAVLNCISAITKQLSPGDRIDALAVSSFGESLVAIDPKVRPLSDIILRTAENGEEELSSILNDIPEKEITGITGLFPHKRFSLVKMKWYKDHTDIYEKAYKFLTIDSYIIFMLTKTFFASESTAWRTMAYDLSSSSWSKKLLDAAQIDSAKLPEVLPAGSFCGVCQNSLSANYRLLAGTKVYTGGHDQLCNAIGSGLTESHLLNCSGTVECVSSVINFIGEEEKNRLKLQQVRYPADEGKYFSFWAPVAGCSSLDWCLRFLMSDKFSKTPKATLHKEIQSLCRTEPTQLMAAPYFNGRGFPDILSSARGIIKGFTFHTSPIDFYQGIMEGITFEDKICIEKFLPYKNNQQEINILASGGGSNSEYWMQMKANIFGKNIVKLCHNESGTMGAMIFAAIGEGYYRSFRQAFQQCIKIREIYRPDSAISEMYDEKYNSYLVFREHCALM